MTKTGSLETPETLQKRLAAIILSYRATYWENDTENSSLLLETTTHRVLPVTLLSESRVIGYIDTVKLGVDSYLK